MNLGPYRTPAVIDRPRSPKAPRDRASAAPGLAALVSAFALMVAINGCALLRGAAKPAAYGAELASCTETSKSWAEYTPCCAEVAERYGRDPSFCKADGGAR